MLETGTDAKAVGKLFTGRRHFPEPAFGEGPEELRGLRLASRTLPPERTQPQRTVLSAPGAIDAGVEVCESQTGWHGRTVIE